MEQRSQAVEQTLAHFGVRGMHWGVRRAAKSASNWGKEAGKMTKNNFLHPILTSRANRESFKKATTGEKIRRATLYMKTNEIKDVNARVDRALAKKAKIKEIKTQYSKQYMAGESAVGKVWAKITAGDKIYADTMYNLNKK